MTEEEKLSAAKRIWHNIQETVYGMAAHDMSRAALRTRASMEHLFILITMGAAEDEGWDDFFGAEMFWSHYAPKKNRSLVEAAGFEVILDEIDSSDDERHQVILAIAR